MRRFLYIYRRGQHRMHHPSSHHFGIPKPTMHVLTVFVGVLNLAAVVVAQAGPQASKIPACVVCRSLLLRKLYALFVLIINQLLCDTKAIATTTCNSTDIPCHCQQKNKILTSIIPCVLYGSNCTDPVPDLYSEWSFCFLPCIF